MKFTDIFKFKKPEQSDTFNIEHQNENWDNVEAVLDERLLDSETGTWTPTIMNASTAVTTGIKTAAGTYEKIGNKVFIECYVEFNSATTVTHISGLPVVANNLQSGKSGLTYVDQSGTIKQAQCLNNNSYVGVSITTYNSIYVSGFYTVS